MSSCVIHTRPPTPIVVEESDDSILSASSLASIYANTRTLKHPQAVYLRPTAVGAQTLKSTSSRIVSLPETVAKFSAKQEIQGRRVVSMPERSGRVANWFNGWTGTHSVIQNTHTSKLERILLAYRFVRSRPTCHTHLLRHLHQTLLCLSRISHLFQRAFFAKTCDLILRVRRNLEMTVKFTITDGCLLTLRTSHSCQLGWIAWARSPPRPIPALHGPLSLPYARCPSWV